MSRKENFNFNSVNKKLFENKIFEWKDVRILQANVVFCFLCEFFLLFRLLFYCHYLSLFSFFPPLIYLKVHKCIQVPYHHCHMNVFNSSNGKMWLQNITLMWFSVSLCVFRLLVHCLCFSLFFVFVCFLHWFIWKFKCIQVPYIIIVTWITWMQSTAILEKKITTEY